MTNQTPESVIAEAMVGAGAPLMHSRVEEAVAGALRKAGMLVERSEQVCAWCPSSARGSAWHNDGKLHPSCGQIDHGQGWVPEYPVDVLMSVRVERDAATERAALAEAEIQHLKAALDGREASPQEWSLMERLEVATDAIERVRAWVAENREFLPRPMAWEIEQMLDGAPEPEREAEDAMYQAGCGSWDCRAPECGRA